MVIGQEYYRKYIGRARIKYLRSYVVKVENGIAYLANGKSFEISTGLECDTDESYIWEPLSPETAAYIQIREQAGRARRWVRKIMELDDVAIEIHQRLNTNMDTRRHYNDLTPDERDSLKKQTVTYLKKNYKQPYWCGHQNAFEGVFGCKRLITGRMVTPSKCLLCPSYVQPKIYEILARLRNLAMIPVLKMNQFLEIFDYTEIEMGNRAPTEREMSLLKHLFAMDQWTIEECAYFLDTIGTEKRKEDPIFKKWGDMVRSRINYNSIFYENSKLKNWQYLQSEG